MMGYLFDVLFPNLRKLLRRQSCIERDQSDYNVVYEHAPRGPLGEKIHD